MSTPTPEQLRQLLLHRLRRRTRRAWKNSSCRMRKLRIFSVTKRRISWTTMPRAVCQPMTGGRSSSICLQTPGCVNG